MPRTATPVGQLGLSLARVLEKLVADSPLSRRDIAIKLNISEAQLSRLFNGERPFNPDQVDLLTASLGLLPSEALAQAEHLAADRPRDITTYANHFKKRVNEEGF